MPEYSLEDSDLEGLSDITVSSVHTSDLSSFEEESEEEPPVSDSTEEGEIISEGARGLFLPLKGLPKSAGIKPILCIRSIH